ncbi:MAG: DUF1972 domain-containing protein [Bacteroidales bacterium]|nr:DUF1972 domain-containing protein [Bacteroidales bacterium]
MNLKIGIIGTRGIPNNYGGFEQFAQYLSKGLLKKGCDVYVYNSHNHPYREHQWEGVNIIHKYDPEYLIGLSGQFIYDFNCILDSRKRNFDIILQLGYTTNSVWHFLLPRKGIRICNPDGMEWKRAKYPKPVKKFLKFAEKLAVKSNRALIADSRAIRDYYIKNYKKDTYYSAYPAEIFENPNQDILSKYELEPYKYNMLIARLQEDNNIETIIQGTIASDIDFPLLIIGNHENKYGKYLQKKFDDRRIVFINAVYNIQILNNLRFFSNIYFHGHSAGGTNPSLLEAMASSALITAHNNPFNKDVLKENAFYFNNSDEIAELLNSGIQKKDYNNKIERNIKEIKENYGIQKIINEYYSVFEKYINLQEQF